ncbi:hypothetical protein [Stenotrophomonas acidaminiphila]|uniref:hypothetical protein n=1 Tax=Stenotrophomonas acidaminiphila TaxID=128780 RepID=UPI001FAEFA61|nr:hypothetical protein [Stenotrophomonas acidaminiphila]
MTNPYREMTRDQLYRACQERAGELLQKPGREPPRRTREERAELAQDTAYLLLALAFAVDTGIGMSDSPRSRMRHAGVNFVDAYMEQAHRQQASARWAVLTDAADLALGGNLSRMDPVIGDDPYTHRSYESDEGLRRALEKLAAVYEAARKG